MVMDLSERIRSINKTNGVEVKPQPPKRQRAQQQKPSIQVAKRDLSVAEMEAALNRARNPENPIDEILERLDRLTEAIEAQAVELKKINKHVNATQKELKKAKK